MKKIMCLCLTLILCLSLVGCGCSKRKKKEEPEKPINPDINLNTNENALKDQQVENFKFEETVLVYDNGTSTLEVLVTNTGTEPEQLKRIVIHIMNGEEEIAEMLGFIGGNIEPGETNLLSSNYYGDITNATAIVYEIIR